MEQKLMKDLEERQRVVTDHMNAISNQIRWLDSICKKMPTELEMGMEEGKKLYISEGRIFYQDDSMNRPLIETPWVVRKRAHEFLGSFVEKLIEKTKKRI